MICKRDLCQLNLGLSYSNAKAMSVREQLRSKYPEGRGGMPEDLRKSTPVEHLRGLRENLRSLDKTTAPGTGGLRPAYLITLAELMEADQMSKLEDFGLRYARGDLPHWFYAVWLSVCTVPIFKTAERDSIRPLGIRNVALRIACVCAAFAHRAGSCPPVPTFSRASVVNTLMD